MYLTSKYMKIKTSLIFFIVVVVVSLSTCNNINSTQNINYFGDSPAARIEPFLFD